MIRCTCGRHVDKREAWSCMWCDVTVCESCYVVHGPAKHPEKYAPQSFVTHTNVKAKEEVPS